MSPNKRQDGVDGYIITSTMLSLLVPLIFSSCFSTNRFICHIGHSAQSTGWLLKVVYWGWLCILFNTADYRAIHQRSCKPWRGSARYKPSLGRKFWGEKKRRSCHDEWLESIELIRGGTRVLTGNFKVAMFFRKLIRAPTYRNKHAHGGAHRKFYKSFY